MNKDKKTFEEAISELEDIVEKLERGELSLEESMEAFGRGVELSKYCNGKLDEAEKRISILIENEKGEIKEEEFNLNRDLEAKDGF